MGDAGSVGSLVQAFVAEIASGEISLIYLDGGFSHAVRKLAAPGDFRVQADFGGTVEPVTPSAPVRAFGDALLRAVAYEWLYARIDLVASARDPLLMELEIIEPDPFLAYDADAPDRLAAALLATRGAG